MNTNMSLFSQTSKSVFGQAGRAIAVGLTAVFVSSPAIAEVPEQARVDDLLGNSSELLIRRNQRREAIQIGSIIQKFNDSLLTVPPNNARAMLRFLSAEQEDLNFYIQTNSHPDAAIYYFPCEIQGGNAFIGWGLAQNESRGCEEGLSVTYGRSQSAQSFSELVALATKQITPLRLVSYCSATGSGGAIGFATSTTGDPCVEAIEQCEAAGGAGCEATSTGRWWTNEEQLEAWLACDEGPSPAVAGTGANIGDQIPALIAQTTGSNCSVRIARPDDVIIVPAPDDVVMAQGSDEILVQTRDVGSEVQVDVIKGAINVSNLGQTSPVLVAQGQRYTYSNSTGEVTTFDRQEALTSVDMEVLCAFASNSADRLKVSACQEELGIDTTSGIPIAFCNREQASGGQEGDRRIVQMSASQGEIKLEYEMFDAPDRLQILHEGRQILDTGFISGNDALTIPISGRSGSLEVIVTGSPTIDTTLWNYLLRCP
ncbi:hypothetical protein PN498_04635 [Oscillatoria sp. CS-180]|uniref:hypothetical protein n=1 Tax=Oscillatoria sp. CS-180 TaxID=3021720 RepID=UPI0023306E4A|nr:hypothetical protein [Oscillatoria sp. CS-180]MDB9525264.1 hypothetical protein [Oscillatoria sp. CS-180]